MLLPPKLTVPSKCVVVGVEQKMLLLLAYMSTGAFDAVIMTWYWIAYASWQ
jgi:hypothetical protein